MLGAGRGLGNGNTELPLLLEGGTEKPLFWDMPGLHHDPVSHGTGSWTTAWSLRTTHPRSSRRELLQEDGDSETHTCMFQRGWMEDCLHSWLKDKLGCGELLGIVLACSLLGSKGLVGEKGSEQEWLEPLIKTQSFNTNHWVMCQGARWPSPSLLGNKSTAPASTPCSSESRTTGFLQPQEISGQRCHASTADQRPHLTLSHLPLCLAQHQVISLFLLPFNPGAVGLAQKKM